MESILKVNPFTFSLHLPGSHRSTIINLFRVNFIVIFIFLQYCLIGIIISIINFFKFVINSIIFSTASS